MKATKFVVGAGALLGITACFLDWAFIELDGVAKGVAGDFPTAGMDQGGPVFLFLLAFPLIAAIVGVIKRMGRGMGAMAFIFGGLASLMAMVKYADIADASALMVESGVGEMGAAGGYWVMFSGCTVAMLGGLIALIKPEPKPEPPKLATAQPAMQYGR